MQLHTGPTTFHRGMAHQYQQISRIAHTRHTQEPRDRSKTAQTAALGMFKGGSLLVQQPRPAIDGSLQHILCTIPDSLQIVNSQQWKNWIPNSISCSKVLTACNYFPAQPGVTILLSLTVFLNMVAETMPATSDAVPLLGKIAVGSATHATHSLYSGEL